MASNNKKAQGCAKVTSRQSANASRYCIMADVVYHPQPALPPKEEGDMLGKDRLEKLLAPLCLWYWSDLGNGGYCRGDKIFGSLHGRKMFGRQWLGAGKLGHVAGSENAVNAISVNG